MGANVSVIEMLAQLEAKVAYHKEQQEVHARQEAFHAEQKGVHEAKYGQALKRCEAFKAASAEAGEILVDVTPPAAASPDLPEDFRSGEWHWLSRLMNLILEGKAPDETFGPSKIVREIRERWGSKLPHKVDPRSVSATLRGWAMKGRIHKVREGRAYYEALYRKERPAPAPGQ
jgi:hypothetical protein